MTYNKGFFGQTNKKNDLSLIKRITDLMGSVNYIHDSMTSVIRGYITRYNEIHSLTDKMRYHMKTHLEKHKREISID